MSAEIVHINILVPPVRQIQTQKEEHFLTPQVSFFSIINLVYSNKFSLFLTSGFFWQLCSFVVLCSSSFLAGDPKCCSFEINT